MRAVVLAGVLAAMVGLVRGEEPGAPIGPGGPLPPTELLPCVTDKADAAIAALNTNGVEYVVARPKGLVNPGPEDNVVWSYAKYKDGNGWWHEWPQGKCYRYVNLISGNVTWYAFAKLVDPQSNVAVGHGWFCAPQLQLDWIDYAGANPYYNPIVGDPGGTLFGVVSVTEYDIEAVP